MQKLMHQLFTIYQPDPFLIPHVNSAYAASLSVASQIQVAYNSHYYIDLKLRILDIAPSSHHHLSGRINLQLPRIITRSII